VSVPGNLRPQTGRDRAPRAAEIDRADALREAAAVQVLAASTPREPGGDQREKGLLLRDTYAQSPALRDTWVRLPPRA